MKISNVQDIPTRFLKKSKAQLHFISFIMEDCKNIIISHVANAIHCHTQNGTSKICFKRLTDCNLFSSFFF